jgi:hypothetical protein
VATFSFHLFYFAGGVVFFLLSCGFCGAGFG